MAIVADCIITRHKKLNNYVYQLTFSAPEIVHTAIPGQFIEISCDNSFAQLLKRPFSIHQINRKKETISILYRIQGKGTQNLSLTSAGQTIHCIGPLGTGFSLKNTSRSLIIAGGMGIAPFAFLINELIATKNKWHLLYGAKTHHELITFDQIKPSNKNIIFMTEDKSYGHAGRVTDLLPTLLSEQKINQIYACGPTNMLEAVSRIAITQNIDIEVSMEARMACGFGVCLGCVIANKHGDYQKVCKDGPVFKGTELWSI